MKNETHKQPQPFRLIYSNGQAVSSKSSVIHIPTYHDSSKGKDMVLWNDIISVFNDASYARVGTVMASFIQGSDLKNLEPLRIFAKQDTIFDIVIKELPTIKIKHNSIVDSIKGNESNVDKKEGKTLSSPLPPGDMDYLGQLESKEGSDPDIDGTGYFKLGLKYQKGVDVPKNYNKSMEYFLKAAEMGHVMAFVWIGYLYHSGFGVPQDFSKAMEWYIKAADQGSENAQRNIGFMHLRGSGVPQDYSKAMEWFLKSASGGDSEGQKQYNRLCALGYRIQGMPKQKHKKSKTGVQPPAILDSNDEGVIDPSTSYLQAIKTKIPRSGRNPPTTLPKLGQ